MKSSKALSTITAALLGIFLASYIALAAEMPALDQEQRPASGKKTQLSYVQLRDFVMDFADEYMQVIGQAADRLQRQNKDPNARIAIHSLKLFPCSSAFSIAVDPDPHAALLDMIVFVHMQSRVWETALPKKYGDKSADFLSSQKKLLTDIDTVALKVLKPDQLEKLKTLADDWLKEHADQRYVSYIRFSDFSEVQTENFEGKSGSVSLGAVLFNIQLGNVDEATRSMDQARMVGERALYIAQRMPALVRWQTQMLFYEIAATPETKDLLATSKAIREFPQRFTIAGLILLATAFVLALLYRIISKKL